MGASLSAWRSAGIRVSGWPCSQRNAASPISGRADGSITAKLSTGSNRANRVITVTAVSAGITKTATVQVAGTKITAVLVPAVVAPGGAAQIQYRVVDSAGSTMSNEPIQIVAAGLTPSDVIGVTGTSGEFNFSYVAPTASGSYSVLFTAGGETNSQSITVQSGGTVPNVTLPIAAASVSATPSVVAVNLAGSTANRSEIRALFLSASNQPLANVRARFDLNGDANSVGGTFTTGNTTLYSDASGVVTTAYVPGTRSSPTDGVDLRVCYGSSDTDPNFTNCVNTKIVTLTVAAEPRTTRVLPRGNWQDESGEVVPPAPPAFLTEGRTAAPTTRETRVDLARWLTARENGEGEFETIVEVEEFF